MSSVPNRAPNVITLAGAITPAELNHINAAGALALTLALPTVDGQILRFIDETGHAHVITIAPNGSPPTAGLNGGSNSTLTFNGTKGSAVELISRNGNWYTGPLNGVAVA
jgi:hypothetical protein